MTDRDDSTCAGTPLADVVAVLQLADSAFPSGRYTLSHGLESYVQSGRVRPDDEGSRLHGLLADQLRHCVATADGVALAWAHRAVRGEAVHGEPDGPGDASARAQAAADVDRLLSSVKLNRESRDASSRVGRGTLGTVTGMLGGAALGEYARLVRAGDAPGNAGVVMGVITGELGVPIATAVAAELHSFAVGWVNAAVRLGVADHRVAQVVLNRCGPVVVEASRRACETPLHDLGASTPLAEVMSMQHEQATLRLFMS